MIQLKDVLHFYLGRDYWTNNSQGNLNNHTLPHVLAMIEMNKNVQLHLIPLESMKDEHKMDLIRINHSEKEFPLIKDIEISNEILFFKAKDEKMKYFRSFGIGMNVWRPNEFAWLIENEYDVFELIKTKQAVDKTKFDS